MAGKKGAIHIKENGWSQDAITKRVATRKRTNGYSTDMSACHTEEAIKKRVNTRNSNGRINRPLLIDIPT
jgi:hypothetical protein